MKTYEITRFVWDMDHWVIIEYRGHHEDFWIYGSYDTREEAEAELAKLNGGK